MTRIRGASNSVSAFGTSDPRKFDPDSNVHDLFSVRNMFFSCMQVLAGFDQQWPILNRAVADFDIYQFCHPAAC
jgi:hypothetical protein